MRPLTHALPGALRHLLRDLPLSDGKVGFAWGAAVGPDRVVLPKNVDVPGAVGRDRGLPVIAARIAERDRHAPASGARGTRNERKGQRKGEEK